MSLKVIQRVKKLLALSQSSNPNEAAAAMAAAQNLIRKHQLEVADLESQTGEVKEKPQAFENEPILSGKKVPLWKQRLFIILSSANGCKPIKTGQKFGEKHLYLVGRSSDVETVRYLFAFCVSEIVRLSRKECKGRLSKYRDDWFHGVVSGIKEQIDAPDPVQTRALVVVDKRRNEADKLASQLYEFGKKNKIQKVFTDESAMQAGKSAGRNMDVSGRSRIDQSQSV